MSSLTWLGRADLAALACPYCGRRIGADDPAALAAEREWGFVGAGLTGHGRRTAVLLLTPVPDSRTAMLNCLWVAPGHAGRGQGRRLVQAAAAGLLSRDLEAILARGARKPACGAPPADFLRAVGFTRTPEERLDPTLPTRARPPGRLWRLDLSTTVTTPSGLRGLVEQWLEGLRPIRPEPAGRVTGDS